MIATVCFYENNVLLGSSLTEYGKKNLQSQFSLCILEI
jgi:hypothetical protein